jgi:hypothetical protein
VKWDAIYLKTKISAKSMNTIVGGEASKHSVDLMVGLVDRFLGPMGKVDRGLIIRRKNNDKV